MKAFIIPAILALVFITGCSKVKDCETNNYGTVTINFGSTALRHEITVIVPAVSSRSKILTIGTASDTVMMSPGTFEISISSINGANTVVEDSNKTVSISKCSEATINVTF